MTPFADPAVRASAKGVLAFRERQTWRPLRKTRYGNKKRASRLGGPLVLEI